MNPSNNLPTDQADRSLESAMRRSEKLFEMAGPQDVPLCFYSASLAGAIGYISPSYEGIFGRPRDAIYRDVRTWLQYVLRGDEQALSVRAYLIRAKSAGTVTYRISRPLGDIRFIRESFAFEPGDVDGTDRMVGTLLDVTPQVTVQPRGHDRRVVATVSPQVKRDRGPETKENILYLPNVMPAEVDATGSNPSLPCGAASEPEKVDYELQKAQQAIAVRDSILAMVSHDLRNPMTTIYTIAGLMKYPLKNAKRLQYASILIRNIKRMNRLLDDLLDAARIQSRGLQLQKRHVNLRELCTDVCNEFSSDRSGPSARLSSQVAATVPENLYADRDRLFQVLANLLHNALKFTSKNGSVRLSFEREDGYVVIRVADTGIGIAPADISRLFDTYWQARPHESTGFGLGLAIVRGIVTAHDGTIWVTSEPQKGSTFFVKLPMLESAAK